MSRNFRRSFSQEKAMKANNIEKPINSLPKAPRHRQPDDGSGNEVLERVLREKRESEHKKSSSDEQNRLDKDNRDSIETDETIFNSNQNIDDRLKQNNQNSSLENDTENQDSILEKDFNIISNNEDNIYSHDNNSLNTEEKEIPLVNDITNNNNLEEPETTEIISKPDNESFDLEAEETEYFPNSQEENIENAILPIVEQDEYEVDILENSNDNYNYDFDPREEVNKRTGIGSKIAVGVSTVVATALLGGAFYYTVISDNLPISIDSSSDKITVPQATESLSYNDKNPCDAFENLNCNIEWVFDNSPKGTLLSQSLEAGSNVDVNSAITLTYSKNKENVEIPNVVGLSENDAKESLYQAGLNITQVSRVSANGEQAGTVIKLENAEPGNIVANDSEVALIVADGTINIPDWTGKTKEFVQAEASNMGIKPVFREEESDAPAGTVISQSIKEQQVSTGDSIEVVIAKNFNTQKKKIPDVVAMSPTEASAKLAEEGFRKITTVVVSNNEVTREQVTQIVPGADTEVELDQDITLIISKPIEEKRNNNENQPNSNN